MTFSTSTESDSQKTGRGGQRPPRRAGPQPNLTSADPYAVLGVPRTASAREIKRAYFDLVRQYPPEEQADNFKLIRAAYEKLRTVDAKAETDLFLFQPPYDWEARKRRSRLDLEIHVEDIWADLQQRGDLGRRNFEKDYHRPDS